jgi:hypothetical protein
VLEESFCENRKSLSLAVKLDVIQRIEAGEGQIDVCKALVLAGSTVRCILKNEDKIKECGETETPLSATKLNRARSSNLIEMERLLMLFIENNVQRRVPLSSAIINFILNKYVSWSW